MEAAPDEEGTGPDIIGASALSYGCSHGKWNMANGQTTDDRCAEDLKARAICSLSFAICHLPFAMPAQEIMLVRQSPAAQPRRLARRRFRDRDFPPETHAGPRAVEREAAGGACIEEVRAGGTARIVNSARARRQQARPPRRECGRRHGEPPGLAGRDGPAPKSRLPLRLVLDQWPARFPGTRLPCDPGALLFVIGPEMLSRPLCPDLVLGVAHRPDRFTGCPVRVNRRPNG